MSVLYADELILPTGAHGVLVQASAHSGWLYHDKYKTYYALFASLSACLTKAKPLKEWEHNSEYPNFEEDVIEWWLTTGWDVP